MTFLTHIAVMKFENVTALAEGNVYFDGKVVSHTIETPDGAQKTLGVMMPGEYHFGTKAAELMEIAAGGCSYILDGTTESITVPAGSSFNVPADSGFTITAAQTCHYVFSYL